MQITRELNLNLFLAASETTSCASSSATSSLAGHKTENCP